jgi:phage terminase large subunit-like protein
MRALATKAKGMPSAAATFKQKRLNLWVNADGALAVGRRLAEGPERRTGFADIEHESCFVGVDLASKIDLCAMVVRVSADGWPARVAVVRSTLDAGRHAEGPRASGPRTVRRLGRTGH